MHLAAQPLVRESYRDPLYTFETNAMGTVNLLESIRELGIGCGVIVVTSDKCYENNEWDWGYRESDAMGGVDPYSASKGAVELIVSSYRRSFFSPAEIDRHGVALASARAGNVIGGGDWSPDHLIVDVMADLSAGRPIRLRNPNSIRPWQHVLDCLSGYLSLANALLGADRARCSEPWNFGPLPGDAIRVRDLTELLVDEWGSGTWEDASDPTAPHEAGVLRLSIDKSCARLDWRPRWNVREAAAHTVGWYRRYLENPSSARGICEEQISLFESDF
jgi:CDP-glucose 4,6-dehydratase